jgi:hypothetical protein
VTLISGAAAEFNNVYYWLANPSLSVGGVLEGIVEGFEFTGALVLHSWVGAAEYVIVGFNWFWAVGAVTIVALLAQVEAS